MKAGQADYQRI